MIRPIYFFEDVKIVLLLVAFGIYIVASIDLIQRIYPFEKAKKKLSYIYYYAIQLLYVIVQLIVTYYFTFNMAKGYVPLYFFVFVIVGFVIYYILLRVKYLEKVNKIISILSVLVKKILRFLVWIVVPIDIIKMVIKPFKRIKIKKNKKKLHKLLQNALQKEQNIVE